MTAAYLVLEFERQTDPGGNLIPLAVRMKLDLASCKIGLDDWQALPYTTRNVLCALPAETDAELAHFATMLTNGLATVGRDAPTTISPDKRKDIESWSTNKMPSVVSQMIDVINVDLDWQCLSRFSRYVLWTLAKKGTADRFTAALAEMSRSNAEN